jgi:hypothetical protein
LTEDTKQAEKLDAASLPVVRGERQYVAVASEVPIFDTHRFEHFARLAQMMAGASLIPDHLVVDGKGGRDLKGTAGNCLLIINQAANWNMDPLSVAQATSLVHGKLCYEGKVIAAVIEKTLGVELVYDWFGEPGTDSYGITITHPDNPKKTISGTVGDWKTKEKSGNTKSNWKGHAAHNQLKYRGDREWCRLWAPGLITGVYAPDEMIYFPDDARAERAKPIPSGITSRLQGAEGDGFNKDTVSNEVRSAEIDWTDIDSSLAAAKSGLLPKGFRSENGVLIVPDGAFGAGAPRGHSVLESMFPEIVSAAGDALKTTSASVSKPPTVTHTSQPDSSATQESGSAAPAPDLRHTGAAEPSNNANGQSDHYLAGKSAAIDGEDPTAPLNLNPRECGEWLEGHRDATQEAERS